MVYEDLHIHTSLSSCAKPTAHADGYIEKARGMGLTLVAFTDHMWDSAVVGASPWYAPQNFKHISQLRPSLPENVGGMRILFGCETECDMHGTVAISRETAQQLDIILVPNSHTHMRGFVMPEECAETSEKHGAFMVRHFLDIASSPVADLITAIPHPFAAVGAENHEEILSTISDAALEECVFAAREKNIALEINTSVFHGMSDEHLAVCEYIRLFDIARRAGCRFTIGSDSHDIASMSTLPLAEKVMAAAEITDDMMLKF